jgi:predicted RNA-binding protein with PUA-like domain
VAARKKTTTKKTKAKKTTRPRAKKIAKQPAKKWKKGDAVPWGVMPREPGERLHWVMKSEPSVFSIDDLRNKPGSISAWDGVRNYTARNFMMQMKLGDLVFFYHSSDEPVGVAGIAEVVRESHPDHTSWDPSSKYHDPKSTPDKPRWFMVEVKWVETFPELLPLSELRGRAALSRMVMLRPGNRLSVTPLTLDEWNAVLALARRSK